MASAHSSPSPIDPAVSQKTRHLRAQPLRSLQHSPSLPNIWFPPHRGPIPEQFKNGIARENLHQPTTPPALSRTFPLPISPKKPDSSASADTPKADSRQLADPTRSGSPSPHRPYDEKRRLQVNVKHVKSDARSRLERQRSHKLLTPPLTPSSSIRTMASFDSVGTDVSSQSQDATLAGSNPTDSETDAKATRFLLVGNVSRTVNTKALTYHFTTALTAANLRECIGSSATSTSTKPPSAANSTTESDSPIKGVFVRYVESQGLIVLAFYDIRYAMAAKRFLSARRFDVLDICLAAPGTEWFICSYVSETQLYQMIGDNSYIQTANFYICLEDSDEPNPVPQEFDGAQLVNILLSFGAIHSLEAVDSLNDDNYSMNYHVEFCDARVAYQAYSSLDGKLLLGKRVRVSGKENLRRPSLDSSSDMYRSGAQGPNSSFATPLPDHPSSFSTQFSHPGDKSQIRNRFVFPDAIDTPRRHTEEDTGTVWSSSNDTAQTSSSPTFFYTSPVSSVPTSQAPSIQAPSQDSSSEHEHMDVPADDASQSTHSDSDGAAYPPCPPNFFYPESYYPPPPGEYGMVGYPPTSPPMPYSAPPALIYPGSPTPPGFAFGYDEELLVGMNGLSVNNYTFDPSVPFTNCLFPPHPASGYGPVPPELWQPGPCPEGTYYAPPHPEAASEPMGAYLVSTPDNATPDRLRFQGQFKRRLSGPGMGAGPVTAEQAVKNQLDLAAIENGIDTRTTVMIKNIPNKMSDRDLINYINRVCARRIDFLYLRMDFTNGCNVGYAFVNFIEVRDLLHFAKKRLGQKWNMFSSDKVLQMSYANYQGKEALVEKFKNSCIMDEQEAWQPKIFYSEPGPQQGLPEPFPAPTHMRRKERSLHNRGTLFAPGGNATGPPRRVADPEDRPRLGGERRSRFRMTTEGLGRHFLSGGGKSSRVF